MSKSISQLAQLYAQIDHYNNAQKGASYTALGTVVDVGPELVVFVELALVVVWADDEEVEDVGGVEVTGVPVPLLT